MRKTKKAPGKIRIPAPVEDAWGAWGTLYSEYVGEREPTPERIAALTRIWDAAVQGVADTFNETNPAVIRNFLRSRWGRHLVNAILDVRPGTEISELDKIVPLVIAGRDNRGRLDWQKPFNEVRKTTLAGEWIED